MRLPSAVRRLLGAALAVACLVAVVSVAAPEPTSPRLQTAADLSRFDPGNIITDEVFYDSASMTAAQVQSFLDAKGENCRQDSGDPACLKDFRQNTSTRAADSLCPGRYAGAQDESAAAIIKKVAVACRINPRVLLVTLQKEMGFITSSGPTWKMYQRAMGMGCPDNTGGLCDSQYNGFFNQLYSASKQFQRYAANPTRYGHVPGMWNNVRYNPKTSCGSSRVFIRNQATASLYNYTPYQPNKAALAAGYGTGDSCSAYGNRNFYSYFTDWFGSTQSGGRDVDAPLGRLETVVDRGGSVLVRGWVYDPNSPAATVRVNVFAGGTKIGTDTTGQSRPDVAAANYGAGTQQGFEQKIPVSAGTHTICVYPVNIGAGYSNPRLGCVTVNVSSVASWNPKGRVADVRVAGTRLVVEGWTFDPDAPTWPTTVRVYAGSLRLGDLQADDVHADVGRYYPGAGPEHGFRLDTRLTQGTHKVCVYAINKGTGTTNPQLGCRTVKVTAPPLSAAITSGDPLGRLATVTVTGQDVRVEGWSFDPDAPTGTASVRIFAGSKLVGTTAANRDWADLTRYFPYAGSAHGFAWQGVLPPGSYNLCANTLNQGAGDNARIGCEAVTVVGDPKANPVGRLDPAEVDGTTVRLDGWAYDPDSPTEPVTVRLYRGSTKLADVVADDDRPGLGEYHPKAGDTHGYVWSGTLPVGTHKICAYAINVSYGTTNPQLQQCRSVTVTGTLEEPSETPTATPTETSTATSTGTSTETSTEASTEAETGTPTSAAPTTSAAPETTPG